MHLIFGDFNIFQGIAYFEDYFKIRQEISQFHNPKIIRQLQQFLFVMVSQFALFIYHYIFSVDHNYINHFIIGNYCAAFQLPSFMNLFAAGIIVCSVFFLYLAYIFEYDNAIWVLLHSILIDKRADFFGSKKIHASKPVCEYIRLFAITLHGSLSIFICAIGKFLIICCLNLGEYKQILYTDIFVVWSQVYGI